MIPFVTNSKCPKANTWTPSYIKQVDEWYANLQAKTHHNKMEDYNKSKDPSSITLWMAWQGIQGQWGQLVETYQVCVPPHLAYPPPSLPQLTQTTSIPCRPTTVCGPRTWQGSATRWCSWHSLWAFTNHP